MDAMLARAEKYVGMPYVEGEFDCADLAALVQRELFGRVIGLPVHRERAREAMRRAREIRALKGCIAEPLAAPQTGCGVLTYEPAGHGLRWHIGTAFVAAGEVWMLHNDFVMGGARLTRVAELGREGSRLEGYYRWKDAP